MTWQDRADQLTGSKDYIFQTLRREGYSLTREDVRAYTKQPVEVDTDELLDHFIAEATKYSPVTPRTVSTSGDHVLLFNPCDLHLGQLSWGMESGENYDSKIAEARYKELTLDAISKSPYRNYEKIYFGFGNDFFNSDTVDNTTTKGTVQAGDVRWQKMFHIGCNLLVWGIEAMRSYFPDTPIETILIPGNHESSTIFHAAMYLYAWFKNDPSVVIDISPRLHKGIAYGATALLFTHGQAELKNLDWVYREFRELIGITKITEIHAGHFHKIRCEEKNGAFIRVNSAATSLDNWSYGQGYNSVTQIITRVYSKEKGLEFEIYSRI